MWEYQTDVSATGQRPLDDGCGSVWSSGTVLPDLGLVVFGTADCNFATRAPYADSVHRPAHRQRHAGLAVPPARPRAGLCDDFGATANAGVDAGGKTTFLGEGARTAPTTRSTRHRDAALVDQRRLRGFSGGFIGTTAYDGHRV